MKCVTLETVKKMSDEELRIAVARLDGHKNPRKKIEPVYCDDVTEPGYVNVTKFIADDIYGEIPDYPHDLNAVHEAWMDKINDDAGMEDRFSVKLGEVMGISPSSDKRPNFSDADLAKVTNAKARLRCEALVLCLSHDSKNTNA